MEVRRDDLTSLSATRPATSEHIPLHRLWTFARLPGPLDSAGQAHLRECAECRIAFHVCLRAENFGSAIKELQEVNAAESEEKPKLRALYIVSRSIPTEP